MNIRKISIDIIEDVLDKRSFSNIVLRNKLNAANLEERDKALITEIVYGTIKYLYTIDNIIERLVKIPFAKIDKGILNILRISVYQMRYLDRVPEYAVVNESVNLAKKISMGASKFVNGVLRSYIRRKDEMKSNSQTDIQSLCYNFSFEKWMVNLFEEQYKLDNTIKILKGLNEVTPISVRVNTLNSDFDSVWSTLKKKDYNIQKGVVYGNAIKIIKGSNIEKNDLFKKGYITVQDESAMLATLVLDVKSDMKVLDLCAAPGGKSTHIGEIMKNTGAIYSCDIHEGKLDLIKNNAKRLGLENITTSVMDASVFNESFENSFDRVLVDAPCSGLGIIKKKPEIKWFKTMEDINSIIEVQNKILENASRYVKKDGILVYSTCTINRNENEKIIENFLKKNNDFMVEAVEFGDRMNFLYSAEGMLTILPDKDMDGFFIAKLRRKE